MADKGQPVLHVQLQLYRHLDLTGHFPIHQEIQICKAYCTVTGRPVYAHLSGTYL